MFEAPKEPQDFGKTLDTGFRLFGAGWKGGMLIALYGILAVGAIAGIGIASLIPMIDDIQNAPGFAIGMGIILGILIVFLWTIFMNALIARFGAVYRGMDLRIGDAIRIGTGKLFPVIGWYLLFGLIVFAIFLPGGILIAVGIASQEPATMVLTGFFGAIIMLVPYLFVAVLFVFGPYLIIVNNMGVMEAFGESKRLVWGNWWRTFAYGIVVTLLLMLVSIIISLPLGIIGVIATFGGNPGASFVIDLVNNLVSMLVYPLSVAMTLPYMFDMQLRRSGLDLAARLA